MKGIDVMKPEIGFNFNETADCEIMLWSPEAKKGEIIVNEKRFPLQQIDHGYWSLETNKIKPGERYKFVLNGEQEFPDPASLSQPQGVHGPSMAIDLENFIWTDRQWKHALEEYILYELQTGTFPPRIKFQRR